MVLTERQVDKLEKIIKSSKHKLATLLMIDCGLKVSECCSLRFLNLDTKNLLLCTRKRTLPLSRRCVEALQSYIEASGNEPTLQDYIFPGKHKRCMSRFTLNNYYKRLAYRHPVFEGLHPRVLRKTCAANLAANGVKDLEIKRILGYEHASLSLEEIREKVEENTSAWKRAIISIKRYFSPVKFNFKSRLTGYNIPTNITFGRKEEIKKVSNLIKKSISVLLLGNIGVGKSHIINQFCKSSKLKLLRIEDLSEIKKTLLNLLCFLYKGDKKKLKQKLYPQYDYGKLQTHLQRGSIESLTKEIVSACRKNEYTIVIDSCQDITKKGIKVMEILKTHFSILTAAREISLSKRTLVWGFEIIRIKKLTRKHARMMTDLLSKKLQVEDYELFVNHIYEQSDGNPRVIRNLIDRYYKEGNPLTDQTVRVITHTGTLPEYDFSPVILFFLAAIGLTRFLAWEIGCGSFRTIGAVAILTLLVSRRFFSYTKKKSL